MGYHFVGGQHLSLWDELLRCSRSEMNTQYLSIALEKPTSCFGKARGARTSNFLFLPDLHSLNLLKGQSVPRSIINPGCRRTRVSGDPLCDLDCAARIHVFGNARRTEAVTTNSFQDPVGLRPFLNQLQDTPTIQASRFNRNRPCVALPHAQAYPSFFWRVIFFVFHDPWQRKEKVEHSDLTLEGTG